MSTATISAEATPAAATSPPKTSVASLPVPEYIGAELEKLDQVEAVALTAALAGEERSIRLILHFTALRLRLITFREKAAAAARKEGANAPPPFDPSDPTTWAANPQALKEAFARIETGWRFESNEEPSAERPAGDTQRTKATPDELEELDECGTLRVPHGSRRSGVSKPAVSKRAQEPRRRPSNVGATAGLPAVRDVQLSGTASKRPSAKGQPAEARRVEAPRVEAIDRESSRMIGEALLGALEHFKRRRADPNDPLCDRSLAKVKTHPP